MREPTEAAGIVLFLDDDENRTKVFVSKIPRARTAPDVPSIVGLIERSIADHEPVSYLFLDHDLGGEIHVDSGREDTGMEVVRYLEKNNLQEHIREVIVHSHNEPAATEMLYKLWDAKYRAKRIPFIHLKDALDKGMAI